MAWYYDDMTGKIFEADEQKVLRDSYELVRKAFNEYRNRVLYLLGLKKKPKTWPRKKSKRFHQMRVGG